MRTSWVTAGPVCNSYGLEFVSLETHSQSEAFLKICLENAHLFDTHTFIGAISETGTSPDDFYWMNSGKKVGYRLQFAVGEPSTYNKNEFCLTLKKSYYSEFAYNDYDCSDSTDNFICQKVQ